MSVRFSATTLFLVITTSLFAQQKTLIDSLSRLLNQSQTDSATVMLKTQLARELVYVDIVRSHRLAEEALQLAEKKGLRQEGAYALRVMGAVLRENGFHLRGAEMILEAKKIFEGYGDQLGVANCYLSLAHVYEYIGDLSLALETGHKARLIFEDLGEANRLGVIYNNLGRAYCDMNVFDSAKYFTRKAIGISTSIGHFPLLQSNYRNMALVYTNSGSYDSAKYYLNEVLRIREALGSFSNAWAGAETFLMLARIAVDEKDYEKVPFYLNESRKISSQHGYLDILKEAMQVAFYYYVTIDDRNGLIEAWERYDALNDSLVLLERENRKEIVDWFEERMEKESAILAVNNRLDRQNFQITGLVIIVILSVIILIMVIIYNRNQRRNNRLLSTQKEELEKLNETKTKLFSIIAHDFRSPIANVYSYSNLIAEHWEKLEEQEIRNIVYQMNSSISNTLSLTENLLSWARKQMEGDSSRPELFDISNLLTRIIKMHVDMAESKEISLKASVQDGLKLYADPRELEVVFRNLIINAIKFSSSQDDIMVKASQEGAQVVISIRDEGIGMDEATVDSLFDIGKKTYARGTAGEPGTGLGLVICKEFIDQNGGTINVMTELGKGSAFVVKFPIP